MPRAAKKKEHPISMRLPEADIATIDRAATLRGRSRTEFVRDVAVRAAEEILLEHTFIRMGARGFSAFAEAVAAPGKAVPAMVALLSRTAPWDKQLK